MGQEQQNLIFLPVLEARSSRSRCQQVWFHFEASLLGLQLVVFSLHLQLVFSLPESVS